MIRKKGIKPVPFLGFCTIEAATQVIFFHTCYGENSGLQLIESAFADEFHFREKRLSVRWQKSI